MEAISLYWFTVQQQTSKTRPQKVDLIYVKISMDFVKLNFKL